MQQGDSGLANIHLSDPAERHVDGHADEEEEDDDDEVRHLWCQGDCGDLRVFNPFIGETLRLLGFLTGC